VQGLSEPNGQRGIRWKRLAVWAVGGAFFAAIMTTLWGVGVVRRGLSDYNPEWLAQSGNRGTVIRQAWSDYVLPFFPANILVGGVVGWLASFRRKRRLVLSLISGLGAVVAYSATGVFFVVLYLLTPGGGYSPEQGTFMLVLLVCPLLGITAAPLWIICSYFVLRLLKEPRLPGQG
jgi:hypothetical protein